MGVLPALALAATFVVGATAYAATVDPPRSIEYEVDMQAVVADFLADGEFTVAVPGNDSVLINATRSCLMEPCCTELDCPTTAYWTEVHENGTQTRHEYHTVPIDGTVVGRPGSSVSMILGEYGLYGTIAWGRDERPKYSFDPRELEPRGETPRFVQVVSDDGSWWPWPFA